ncbi:uncharacterized protein LOC112575472 isoform X2 [Pomacea canaliculata]|uniref:uncharacterized protein LOC112575472 isoform X2 n=1 Tax=Pomacea canaliculata TaxID=400727 RepID=UPI000D72FF04|nr:uncharacterized protein LOC112575472 isoform X2 [Pomacea canaliculata]
MAATIDKHVFYSYVFLYWAKKTPAVNTDRLGPCPWSLHSAMSNDPPLSQQDERKKRSGRSGPVSGGGRVVKYLHVVTDKQASFLSGNTCLLPEVNTKSGAKVQLHKDQSPVPGTAVVAIHGVLSQIEAAVRIINEMCRVEESMLEQAHAFWLQWVEASFPDLDSRAYFLPPVYFNRVPMTRQSAAGQDVLVLQSAPGQAGQSDQSAPEQAGQSDQSAPGQAGQSEQSAPEQAGQSEQSAPEQAGQSDQSAPGQAGQSDQSAPEQAGQSDQSAPEQAGQSDQSAPGQAGQLSKPAMIASASETSIPQIAPVNDSDVRDDLASQRVFCCLQKMYENKREVLFGMSHFRFGQYLSESCYSAACSKLPLPRNLPNSSSKDRQGDFDILIIHRMYGFVVFEVKSFGGRLKESNILGSDLDYNIRKKLRSAMSQLDKAEAMLSHLVSDIAPGLRITKTIAFPNLTTRQIQDAVSEDTQLAQNLCRCLGTSDPSAIAGLCLCSDQLSDPMTPCDVSSHVLKELGHWWHRRVAGAGPDSHMTSGVYKTLVARFCGPATTVSVPCTCPPRVSVKTLGQAVWWTGECYTAVITLFPEQVHLLNKADPRVFVSGPPGTGKTVVLQLMAIEWLRCGHSVYIVSAWWWSSAASIMLHHLLQKTVEEQQKLGQSPGQLHLLQYDFRQEKNVKRAVNDLSQAAMGGSLYVIADEAESDLWPHFQTFCNNLLKQVPRLHLWAASCYQGNPPTGWQEEYLTRPLRFPLTVVREVEEDVYIKESRSVQSYIERGVPDHTDGPPVTRLYHRGQGHSGDWPGECVACGHEVASFLHSLRSGILKTFETATSTSSSTSSPCLQWRDVLVLYRNGVSSNSGIIQGLEETGIPVKEMKDDDIQDEDIEDVATARSDVVWVADGHRVRGLERKIIVCLDPDIRFHSMSRCVSQLVIVYPDDQTPQYEPDFLSDFCYPL